MCHISCRALSLNIHHFNRKTTAHIYACHLSLVIVTTEDFLPTKTQRCLHIVKIRGLVLLSFALQSSGDAVKIDVTLYSVS